MNIRQIDGKTVLSYFNAVPATWKCGSQPIPTGLGTAPVTTVVRAEDWPDQPTRCPTPPTTPGPALRRICRAPGSTLDEVRVFVSQWNTLSRDRSPYRVIQFAVNPFKP